MPQPQGWPRLRQALSLCLLVFLFIPEVPFGGGAACPKLRSYWHLHGMSASKAGWKSILMTRNFPSCALIE